ncbi:MAG: hypothetical protein HGA67_03265 [Candidatus Yonathbacteria bacterium]|nr:hypothetical protein [Candidatus Yonathbacteria bacterium]
MKQSLSSIPDGTIHDTFEDSRGHGGFINCMNRSYLVIPIGNTWWTAENLDTKYFRNGDPIPEITENDEWTSTPEPARCHYLNLPQCGEIYGSLYNFAAVTDPRTIAPPGWHVATDEDWIRLEIALGLDLEEASTERRCRGEDKNIGGLLKEAYGTTRHWRRPNLRATNAYRFTALPGGYRNPWGRFADTTKKGFFWSNPSDNTKSRQGSRVLFCERAGISRDLDLYRDYGLSVRCVKDA